MVSNDIILSQIKSPVHASRGQKKEQIHRSKIILSEDTGLAQVHEPGKRLGVKNYELTIYRQNN